ncbi:MAG: ABC transporter ATP-binding protein, partial [bacterium]|nr:ABC transporter ATP-binding protein [bacterium]
MTSSPAFVSNPTIEVTEISKWFGQNGTDPTVSCTFGPGITELLRPNRPGQPTPSRMPAG